MSQAEALLLFALMVGVLLVWVAVMAWSARDSALRPRDAVMSEGVAHRRGSAPHAGRAERASHQPTGATGSRTVSPQNTDRPTHVRS